MEMIIHLIHMNFVNYYIGKKCILYIVIHQSESLCGVFGIFYRNHFYGVIYDFLVYLLSENRHLQFNYIYQERFIDS